MEELLRRWVQAVGDPPGATGVGRELLERYAEPHRSHHDQRHVAEVVQALDALCGGEDVPATVLCAALWHDAVYDPTAPDNEERSAALARDALQRIGLPAEVGEEVARLVLATVTHAPVPGDRTAALLCDADLSVLGSSPERYAQYAQGVRREYAHLDDATFRRGRSAVLRVLVERPRLFSTPEGERRWEAAARRNLQVELSRLAGAAGADPPL